jgi:hypothetical protein
MASDKNSSLLVGAVGVVLGIFLGLILFPKFARLGATSSDLVNRPAIVVPTTPGIRIEPEVIVTRDRSDREYAEMIAAANPSNPKQMIACTIAYSGEHGKLSNALFTTLDGGASWKLTVESSDHEMQADPSCIYGTDNTAWFGGPVADSSKGKLQSGSMDWYKSTDGGQTWNLTIRQKADYDRPYVIADTTNGPYRGRVYIYGWDNFIGPKFKWLGATVFLHPVISDQAEKPATFQNYRDFAGDCPLPSEGVVTDNGTVVIPMEIFANGPEAKPHVTRRAVTRSLDGGKTLLPPTILGDMEGCTAGLGPGPAAIDTSDGPFHGRIYMTWPSADRPRQHGILNRCHVSLAYSSDDGKTWSSPVTIHERGDASAQSGPNQYQPTVAVNKNGVVALTWYDTRENPAANVHKPRAAFSFDGGVSFSTSVPISDHGEDYHFVQPAAYTTNAGAPGAPNNPETPPVPKDGDFTLGVYRFFLDVPGHTRSTVADAAGAFHPFWFSDTVDAKNPHASQLMTATIHVEGKSSRNGDPSLDGFRDVTADISPQVMSTALDPKTGELRVAVHLINNSDDPFSGPVVMRIKWMDSQFGPAVLVSPNMNGINGNGAIVEMSAALPDGKLSPGSTSQPIQLVFNVNNQGEVLPAFWFDLAGRVFAH